MSFDIFLKENKIEYLENEPMCRHTTFRIGGNARFFALPANKNEFCRLLDASKESNVKTFVLGKGSNVLFADEGYEGLVISTEKLCSYSVTGEEIFAECGLSLTALSKIARDNSLKGLEFANGIPGSVGGAVYMNAGAYGGQMSDVVLSTECFDINDNSVSTVGASEHCFGYRKSCFLNNPNRIILSTRLKLKKGNKEIISSSMQSLMEQRKMKQPLEYPSAGSTFKRPEGHFTGQMIEESGLKGFSIGGAQVSEKHAGFVINRGNATAHDVLALVEHIKECIFKNYGVTLECEIIFVK